MTLKPCPFCGGEAAVMYGKTEGNEITVSVICKECHIGIFKAMSDLWDGFRLQCDAEAAEAWNRRAKHEND